MANPRVQQSNWIYEVSLIVLEDSIQRQSQVVGDLAGILYMLSGALKNTDTGGLGEKEITELSEVIRELGSISKVWR
jgi:hypothetical protein